MKCQLKDQVVMFNVLGTKTVVNSTLNTLSCRRQDDVNILFVFFF